MASVLKAQRWAESVNGSIDGVRIAAEAQFTANKMTFTTDSAVSNGKISAGVTIPKTEGDEKEQESYFP
jgi:hypothetical protein